MSLKQRLVVFSPLPPAKNGIADYCAELLPELSDAFDVTVVVDDSQPELVGNGSEFEVIPVSKYLWSAQRYAADHHLYQIGNNAGHVFMLPVLLLRPGVVVLHDLTLHHLIDCATLRWGDVDGYTEALQTEHGFRGRQLADEFRRTGYREQAMFYEMPLIRLIASRSRAIVVHSLYAKLKVLAQEPGAFVTVIPHHVSPVVESILQTLTPESARAQLGVAESEFFIVSLGFITKSKQIDKVLEALALVRNRLPQFRYVLAGKCDPAEYDVWADIRRHGLEDMVHVTGYVSDADFFVYARAADLVLNLRFPTGGETSGTLIRSLGMGACVVVADIGPFAELPNDGCVKLAWGPEVTRDIAHSLLTLGHDPARRAAIGARGRRFIREVHQIGRSAAAYADLTRRSAEHPVAAWSPQQPLRFPALAGAESIVQAARDAGARRLPLWFREMLVPLAHEPEALALACLSGGEVLALLSSLGYRRDCIFSSSATEIGARLHEFTRRSFSLVLVEDMHFASRGQATAMLQTINARLQFGGALVASIRFPVETRVQEFVEGVEGTLREHGFQVARRSIAPTRMHTLEPIGTEDEAGRLPAWCAVKVSEFHAAPHGHTP